MRIEYTNGCTCFSLKIDGKETVDMDKEDVKKAIIKLIEKEDDLGALQQHLEYLVEDLGEWTSLGTCEECGDSIEKFTIDV